MQVGKAVPIPALDPNAAKLAAYRAESFYVPESAQPGEGTAVWLTFDPSDSSRRNQALAFRYLDLAALVLSDEKANPDQFNQDMSAAIANFEQMISGGGAWTGKMTAETLKKLYEQVIATNIINHNANIAKGLRDADWITTQKSIPGVLG